MMKNRNGHAGHIRVPTNQILSILVILFSAASCSSDRNTSSILESTGEILWEISLFDSLTPLFPDTEIREGIHVISTDTFRDSTAGVAVLVRPPEIDSGFRIDAEYHGTGNIILDTSELIPVPVHENTGFFGMTERQMGFHNSHVVRNAPFNIYEVLDNTSPLTFSENSTRAFYVKADTEGLGPGEYTVSIAVSDHTGTVIQHLRWIIVVHDVVLPEGPGKELYYTNWFRGPLVGFENRFDDDWWEIMDEHLAFMRDGGQNVALVPASIAFDTTKGSWSLNPDRLDRFMSLCESHGFLRFEGPKPGYRKYGFLKKGIVINPGREDTFTDEAAELIQDTYGPLYEFLEHRGSLDVWMQHIIDEPMAKHAEDYQWVAAQMRQAMPGVRIIDATKTRNGLVGAVDVWSPLVSEYQKHRKFFLERQDAGEEVWIYSCMVPGGKWLNRTMDQERLRSVYVGWGAAKFDVSGFLRWDLDRWRHDQDIWAGELTGSEDDWVRRPFGDGFVIYPDGRGGFLSTTRWEAGRIGMEDYRLLMMLKDQDPERFEEIVAMCFTDFKTYETDPVFYREAKRTLLEALAGDR